MIDRAFGIYSMVLAQLERDRDGLRGDGRSPTKGSHREKGK